MPRPIKPRSLEEYHSSLGRLLRQVNIDARASPKLKKLLADALEELQRLMLKP